MKSGERTEIVKLLAMQCSSSYALLLAGTLLRNSFYKTLILCPYLAMGDQVSNSYKTAGNIKIAHILFHNLFIVYHFQYTFQPIIVAARSRA
jgi:hypothetical protein